MTRLSSIFLFLNFILVSVNALKPLGPFRGMTVPLSQRLQLSRPSSLEISHQTSRLYCSTNDGDTKASSTQTVVDASAVSTSDSISAPTEQQGTNSLHAHPNF